MSTAIAAVRQLSDVELGHGVCIKDGEVVCHA